MLWFFTYKSQWCTLYLIYHYESLCVLRATALKTSCPFKQGTRENKGSRLPTFPAPSPLSLASSIFPFSPFGRPQQHHPTKTSVWCTLPTPRLRTWPNLSRKENKNHTDCTYICRVVVWSCHNSWLCTCPVYQILRTLSPCKWRTHLHSAEQGTKSIL